MTYSNLQTVGRPLTAKDEGLIVGNNVGSLDFTGAGITATGVGADITVDVPGAGAGLQKETPVGVIDGSNKVFTVSNTPKFIQLNGAVQEDGGEDYTLVALTITFVNPPPVIDGVPSILRSYY